MNRSTPVCTKVTVTFIEMAAQTPAQRTIMEIAVAAENSLPHFCHEQHPQTVVCLGGELSIQMGHQVQHLRIGEAAIIPARVPHRFFNKSKQACRFHCVLKPGSVSFEQQLQLLYGT